MLLGYNPETGEIKFVFTDSSYLKKQFPNNTAKISNFWKYEHGLKEYFVEDENFKDFSKYQLYKIIENKIVKKSPEEIIKMSKDKKEPLKVTKGTIGGTNLNFVKNFQKEKYNVN